MRHDPFLNVKLNGYYSNEFSSEAEEWQFLKNRKKLKNLRGGYYLNNPIEYKINKYNYRCSHENIDDNDYWIALGCSHTFGVGLHTEHRYSDLLEYEYDCKVFNLGVPGGSQNLVKDNLLHLISSGCKLPKLVIIQWPADIRLWFGYQGINWQTTKIKNISLKSLEYYSKIAREHVYWMLDEYKIPFIEFQLHGKEFSHPKFYIDKARDLDHPGIDSNASIFIWLKEQIDAL